MAASTSNPEATAEPRCGRCGYGVTGLPTTTCPECGSDLTVVGIQNGRRPLRDRRLIWIALWTAAVVVGYVALAGWSELFMPRVTREQRTIFCHPNPSGGLFGTIDATTERWAWAWPGSPARAFPPGRVTLTLQTGGAPQATDLHVDWPTRSYRYTTGDQLVSGANGFGPAALLAWLADCGCRPAVGTGGATAATAVAQAQASGVIAAIDQMRWEASTTGSADLGPGHTGGLAEPTDVYAASTRLPPAWAGTACLAVWIAGAIYLVRSRDRYG